MNRLLTSLRWAAERAAGALHDPLRRWAIICAVFLLGLGVALLSLISSHSANQHSTNADHRGLQLAQCVNDTLGDRNELTARQNRAELDIALARAEVDALQATWDADLALVLTAVPNSTDQALKYAAWFKANTALSTAQTHLAMVSARTAQTLADVQHERDLHPLGKC